MKKSGLVFFFCAVFVFVSIPLYADTITKPHDFSPGTVAKSSEVNENFDTLYDQVNKLGNVIDIDTANSRAGINTDAPTEALEVNGTVKATTFVGDGSGLSNITDQNNDYLNGVGGTANKRYIGNNIPFTDSLWLPSTSALFYRNWCNYGPTTSNNYIATKESIWFSGTNRMRWNNLESKKIILEFMVKMKNVSGGCQGSFGLFSLYTVLYHADNRQDCVNFIYDTDGKLYAHVGDDIDAVSNKILISDVTITNSNLYRIEFTPAVEAKFYVNGALKATVTNNLPHYSSEDVRFGFGSSGTGMYPAIVSMPYFAFEF